MNDGRPFTVQEHHAPQGAAGCGEVEIVRQAGPRNHRLGQARHARSGHESAAARGDHRRARREHDQGHHRARHQEGLGRRRRELRGNPLRRLWAGRRRGDRRSADRQPQPHRGRSARHLHQERRQFGRDRRGLLHVRSCRRHRIRRQGGERRSHVRGGAGSRRRRCGVERERPRDLRGAGRNSAR